MFRQAVKSDEKLKNARNPFPEPEVSLLNQIALKLHNLCSDGNQGISAEWFEFYIELYKIDEVEYMAEAMHLIRSTISNFDSEFEEVKKKGALVVNDVEAILRGKGRML